MRKILDIDIQKELTEMIKNKKEELIYCIYDNPVVFKSLANDVNIDYCLKHNITNIIETSNLGGTIVSSAGDLGIAVLKKRGFKVGDNFLEILLENFKDRIPNLHIDNNDLIGEEKYKMASFASAHIGDHYIYTIIQISMNPNIEHIKNICSKKMTKIPRGFNSYGINVDEIVELIPQIDDLENKKEQIII